MARRRQPRIRGALARALLRVPILRRFYLRWLLAYLERAERRKRPLPAELRQLQDALARLPKARRLPALEAALRHGEPELPSRSLRRAAAKQAKRGRGRQGRS